MKEVGVGKVPVASEANIVFLFLREFVLLITIAFAVAAPIAGYFMLAWLQEYAFRVNMSWWIFLEAGILSSLIAPGTVSCHDLRAARPNPVQCLRTE